MKILAYEKVYRHGHRELDEAQAAGSTQPPQAWLRKWREVKRRPVQGNSPNDRMLRGPDCNRPKRVCTDSFPATPSPQPPDTHKLPGMRFLRHAESIGPMWSLTPLKTGAGLPPPVGRPRGPAKGRDGRSAPCSSSAMSSDRLFLDRVARQQSPSPLHRQPDHKTVDESQETDYH
jgi:hypothetical protein